MGCNDAADGLFYFFTGKIGQGIIGILCDETILFHRGKAKKGTGDADCEDMDHLETLEIDARRF